MNKLLVFLFISTVYISQAQEIRYVKIDQSCESGITKAEKDIENGIYKILSYGLIMRTNQEFHDFYVQYVLDKYQVILGDGGCLISDQTECYTEVMRNAVSEKFGKDFFEKSFKDAKIAFDNLPK